MLDRGPVPNSTKHHNESNVRGGGEDAETPVTLEDHPMSYAFRPNAMYRMPTHFGPSLGPRQGVDGRRFACRKNPKTTTVSVSFLTGREQLDRLLPDGFRVGEEPVVTVAASYMTEIE